MSNTFFEEFKVFGHELAGKVRELIHEGNVRKVVIKNENGKTLIEIPVTVAAVGAVIVPELAVLSTIVALASKYTIQVEKTEKAETRSSPQ
jgi:ribosomal 30S subunit maturation factor RimM